MRYREGEAEKAVKLKKKTDQDGKNQLKDFELLFIIRTKKADVPESQF